MNTRISYIRLTTLFIVSQAAVVYLLNQRQELALLLFIPTILVAPLLLRPSLIAHKSPALSIQNTVFLIILIALVSNLSYFTPEIKAPFEHWIRLLFPLLLMLLSIKTFRNHESEIEICVVVFTVLFIFSVLKTFDASATLALQHGVERQTNWGNAVAAASPFIFLLKNSFLRNMLLFVAVSALIVSLKRTGFLAAAVLIFAYVWPALMSFRFKRGIAPSKIRKFLLGAAVIAVGGIYLTTNQYFAVYFMRAETRILLAGLDGGSGRLDFWQSIIILFLDSSFFELLFGRGFGWYNDNYQALGLGIVSLHNDFLEFLISFGILGAMTYGLLIGRLFVLAIAFRDLDRHASFAISLALVFLVYSMFAGVFYYSFFFTPLVVGMGYLEAQNPNRQMVLRRTDVVPEH